jgi:hypothetical protein
VLLIGTEAPPRRRSTPGTWAERRRGALRQQAWQCASRRSRSAPTHKLNRSTHGRYRQAPKGNWAPADALAPAPAPDPETGFNEHKTADYVARRWSDGPAVHRGIGGTGLVASLRVGQGAGVIGLRADMDALAMTEQAEGAPMSRATRAACMAAATTATWPCCWARPP